MTHPASTPRPPAGPLASEKKLALGLLAAVVVGAAVGAATGPLPSAAFGAAAVGAGAVLGLLFLFPAPNRAPARLGLMVLASSTTRMLATLMIAAAALVLVKPDPLPFFASLCAGFVLTLVVETAWAVRALRPVGARRPEPASPSSAYTSPARTSSAHTLGVPAR